MDYISREAALSFPFANGKYDHDHADEHFINGCESYREWLEQQPAADVVEVRHGRWLSSDIPGSILDKCSECGFNTGSSTFNYCPNCGAKMNGGQDDG